MVKRKPVGAPSTEKQVAPTEYVTPTHPQAISTPHQHAFEHQQWSYPEVAAEGPPVLVEEKKEEGDGVWVVPKKKLRLWAIVGVVVLLAIVGVVVGVVLGTRGSGGGDGQGNQDGGAEGGESKDEPRPTSDSTASSTSASSPKATSVSGSKDILDPSGLPKLLEMGANYNASFTIYGTGDGGSGANCSITRDIACGFYSRPGYTAALSEYLYQGSSSEYGDACGTCWLLEAEETSSGSPFKHSTVVVVNDICTGSSTGKDMCGQKSINDLNDYDTQVNFNLCVDSGAADDLFDGDINIGLAIGSATRVSCEDEWEGKITEDP